MTSRAAGTLLCLVLVAMPFCVRAADFALPDPGILPGDWLYVAKSIGEQVRTAFTFGDEARAKRYLALSERRLAEAQALADAGKEDLADKAFARYEEQMGHAAARVERLKSRGDDRVDALVERLSTAALNHQEFLAETFDGSSTDLADRAQHAVEAAQGIYTQALKGLNDERLNAMKQRLFDAQQRVQPQVLEFLKNGAQQLQNSGLIVPCSQTDDC